MPKINCPNPEHRDSTPSCEVYPNGSGYCFGCGTHFPSLGSEVIKVTPKPKEDITSKIEYIKALPKVNYRGLDLPHDDKGYYILWPDSSYYKLRLWDHLVSKSKYLNPSGIRQPMFRLCSNDPTPTAIIIEGELNALSIQSTAINVHIYSPGSASNFYVKETLTVLPSFNRYSNILILADNDEAGSKAAESLKAKLIDYVPNTSIYLMDMDANEILVKYGKETLKDKVTQLVLRSRL